MADGMLHRAGETARSDNIFGILYAEDFDEPAPGIAAAAQEAPPPAPAITPSDVQDACANAVRAARLEWQASQDQMRLAALTSLSAALTEVREAGEQAALAITEETVGALLSMLSGVLPHFCREHGPAEARALAARLLPTIRSSTRIMVRVHPELVQSMQREVGSLEPEVAATIDVVAAPLEPGDVKVNWENGSLSRDTRQIMQAINDALSQVGLNLPIEQQPVGISAKRSLAYAD